MNRIILIFDYAKYLLENISKVIGILRGVISDFPNFQTFEKYSQQHTSPTDPGSDRSKQVQEITPIHHSTSES
jgi:hypothetical protein